MKKALTVLILFSAIALIACSGKKTYTAKSKGYGGEITVELTAAKDKITAVKVTGDKETPGIGEKAVKELPAAVLKAQNFDVDVIAGATITSTAVKKAVKDAMQQAGLISAANPCDDPGGTITLESINRYLNESADMGAGSTANVVAVIPVAHINGPREEHDFYAFVNFKYKARNFIKYQVTYLSCTCRSAEVNYWSTAYVEVTLPKSGSIDDAAIKYLSFDHDAEGNYLAGFWGDSNPTPAGATYEDFKREYIPFFVGKDYKYLKTLSTTDDIAPEDYSAGEGRASYKVDSFTGSSVSTNNIIRMLNALFEYHATDDFFTQK
ncbi:FMN-binding protein [Treponema sp. HNW]|uniref:FMN-binding protein n=1 Tax=Treponema sp. HNW TaxID=3116654 RepID=UPI003D0C3BE3